jgi:putative acetyltransferase
MQQTSIKFSAFGLTHQLKRTILWLKSFGNGIGQQLMTHAKQQRNALSLSVYKQNEASYQFYLKQGFSVKSEQADEHTGCMEYSMTFDVK